MNVEHPGYRSYHTANLETRLSGASPVQLVLVLTDGLLDELARARAHIAARRYEAKGQSIGKCIAVIQGLNSALETDAEQNVVKDLALLYDYCAWRLVEASNELSVEAIDEVVGLVGTLREGWAGTRDE